MPETNPIAAYLLDGQGSARVLDAEALSKWQPDDGVLWVHLNYKDAQSCEWLNQSSGLDSLTVEALLAEETRPRVTPLQGGLLILLRGVNLHPEAEPEDMVSVRVWINKNQIFTSQKRELLSVIDINDQLVAGLGPVDAASFIVDLVDRLIARISDIIDELEDKVDDLEEQLLSGNSRSLRSDLADLRRQAIAIRRYLAPQREALSRLIVERASWLDDTATFKLREANDRLIRNIEDIDALRERASVTQEELQNRLSEQLNNRMYVLSVVAAIFLPLGFVTGLLGVNVGGIPGGDNPNAFLILVVSLVAVVGLLMVFFRFKKWM